MKIREKIRRFVSFVLALIVTVGLMPVNTYAAQTDAALQASLDKAKSYIDGITINNSSNDPATVVKTFKKHFTWDNEKRENSKSYLFDWSYYNGVVFEGLEYVYEVTGESVYRDYVVEYMSSLINSNGTWANCTNSGYTSKQCAGYNNTHGADCYMTAALLVDAYQMTGDNRYLTMANTLYADLDSAAGKYSLSNAGNNYRHTWASDPSPDLWLDGLYMILPFRAEFAKHIGDTAELDLIVSRMQWVSDNMYNSSRKLFYHAADSATSNSGTFWLRSIGWYAAAIVDIMDSMSGANLEAMKAQLVKLVDGMKACQNTSNGMWLNNMAASQSSTNPYETSGTALVCYAVMKAVNNGWLDKSYADMAILAFNGICNEKLIGNNLKDICFKGAPGSSNSTFYDNEGKGLGPFIMFYAETLEYVNNNSCDHHYESVTQEASCIKPGAVVYTCVHCADSYSEEIPATGIHNYENITVDATETTDGSVTHTCTDCGDSYVEVIPATGETLYSLDKTSGAVAKNAGADAVTGAKVIITYATGRKEYADVTVSMLKTAAGKTVSTAAVGTQKNLTVTYAGNVLHEEFELMVEPEWTVLPSGYVYTLDTNGVDIGSDNKYLVVGSNQNYALTLSGTTIGAAKVTVDNNTITLENPANYEFYFVRNGKENNTHLLTRDGSKSVYHSGGNMYYGTDNKGYWYIGSNSNGAYQVYDYDNLNWYLNYGYVWGSDSVSRFAVSSNARAVRLFKLTGAGTGDRVRLNGDLEQFFTTAEQASVADVLSRMKIQRSTDGVSTNGGDVAVNAGMVSWNKTFDGKTAGTYTGTVTYEGVNLGSFTVTVSLEHAYETITAEPTCTEDGSVTTRCTVCGEKTVEIIKATGHSYNCEETEATCGKDGVKVYTCSACKDSYRETIPATEKHDFASVTVEATCVKDGSVTTTCTVCGKKTVEEVKAPGHDYKCVETTATCGKNGSKVFTCSRCADSYTETIKATGKHSYESVRVEPTCVSKGSVTYTCAVCEDSYQESVPATGKHLYQSETQAATCVEDGRVTYTCETCDDSYHETIKASGHNYTCTVTAATCTESGSKVYTCSVCNDSYAEEIKAIGHDYRTVVTVPTCTESGFTTYTCAGCADSYVADETAALGHSYETAVVDPTCTKAGSITYYCACGDSYDESIPSDGHDYKAVVTAPTCTETGYTTYTCTVCGDSYVSDSVAAMGHKHETVTVKPTCTTGGYTADTCAVCGDYRLYDEVDALGHDYLSVTVDPTETEGGYTTYTCTACGHSYTDNYVDALGHSVVSVVTDPTCTEQGYTTHTCTVCGEVTVDTYVPALGHDYKTATVDATCTADGSVTKTCTHCYDTSAEVIQAYGHDYKASVTSPTCTEDGHTVYACERCGDSYVADQTKATGHNYKTITVDVTCTEGGYTTYLCTNCGDSYVGDTAEALGHDYETLTADATCTEDGSVTHICSRCGDSHSEVIPAIGHDYKATVTAPTCTEEGYTTHTCSCGQSYVDDKTPATGHDYSCVEENGDEIYTCDACGDTYTVSIGWIPLSGTYVLDTNGIDIGADHKYIVLGADADYALTLSGSTIGKAQVAVENNTIVLENPANYEFYFVKNSRENNTYLLTRDGSNTVYHMGGNMYYGNDNKGYWAFGSGSNGKYQLRDYDNINWYLNYGYVWGNDAVNRFAVSSNARSVRLFQKSDSFARLCGKLKQTWTHGADVTEHAVLSLAQIQTSSNGITADTTSTVTGGMVTWDKAFDGYTAGTYTATVTYRGEKLGTITVTVTGEHNYEDVVVDATCTENGSVTHICTICGKKTVEEVPAIGHNYSCVEENGDETYTCNVCGDVYTVSISWVALSGTYVLDTDGVDTGVNNKYLIVGANTNQAMTLSGTTVGKGSVNVVDNTIVLTDASRYEFYFQPAGDKLLLTQDGSRTIYHENAKMKYGNSNAGKWNVHNRGNGKYQIVNSDGNGNWSLNLGYVWGTDASSNFAVSYYERHIRLFKEVNGYARLCGTRNQTWERGADVTENAVLSKLQIQISANGNTADEVIPVDRSMITWDKPLDGFTAGTYTATVTYQGQKLNTITVTVTG